MTMWQTIKNNPTAVVWAVVIHIIVFAAISVSFKSSEPKISPIQEEKVIEAVAIDESRVNAEIKKLIDADKRKKREQKRQQTNTRNAIKKRKKEERRLKAIKKEQQKQQRLNKKKQLAENKRLAALEKKRKEQEVKEKETQEKINDLEKQRLEKQAQLEKEEKQRQEKLAEAKRKKAEQVRLSRQQTQIVKYKKLIKKQITNKWIFPASYQKGMKCKVRVKLIPSGEVVSVRVIESSGNSAFNRSVEMAVNKASPLLIPKSSEGLFKYFRDVELVFDPNS